jgi:HK97 family phage portal protein
VRQLIGVSIGLEEHQARFIGQGARTGGVLSTDQKFANKEVREQLREEWRRLQAGPKNSGATAILEQGLKWQPLGLSMVDAQFIDSRKFQLRDVARAFDVPPYKLAIEGESEGPAMVQMGQQFLIARSASVASGGRPRAKSSSSSMAWMRSSTGTMPTS